MIAEKVKILAICNRLLKSRNIFSVQEKIQLQLSDKAIFWSVSNFDNQVLRFLDMLQMWLRKIRKADFVFIDVFSTRAFWFAWIFGLLSAPFKARLVLILHGGNLPFRYQKSTRMVRLLLSKADNLITPSNYLKEFFALQGFNATTINNSIDIAEYPFKHRTKIRPAFMAIRGFGKPYNPLLTLRAFKIVLSNYPQAKLLLLGNPDEYYYHEVIRFIANNNLNDSVTVKNKIPKADWINISQNYDVMISNPDIDNTPVSIIEGQALGMCIISSNVGGISFILNHEHDALLVEQGDVIGLSNAMMRLLKDEQLCRNLSENARIAARKYDWASVRLQWLELLGIRS